MKGQIASEFRKLTTTRSAYWLLVGLLVAVALTATAGLLDETAKIDLTVPLERQPFVLLALMVTTTLTMILGIRSFTDEFRHGSIVPTFLASPDRRRVLIAKLVAAGVAAIVFAMAAEAVALAVGVIGITAKGGVVTWSPTGLGRVGASIILASVLWSIIGVGVGLAVRHQFAAIVGVFLWSLVFETAVGAVVPALAKFMPDPATSAIVGYEAEELLPALASVLVLVAWAVIVTLGGAWFMQRRDVV